MTIHSESRSSAVYFDSQSVLPNTMPRKVVKPVKTNLYSNGSIPSPISQFDVHQRQPSADETAFLQTQPLATPYKADNKLEKQTTLAGLEKEMRAHPDSGLLAQFIAAHKELDTYL